MKRYLPFGIIAGVLLIAIVAGLLLFRSAQQPAPMTTLPPLTPAAPVADFPAHIRGNVNAPITLEEYGDYQCPPCGAIFPELKKIEEEYGARVRFIFRHFPLTRPHPHALLAAHAAEAAGFQNRFWEMHDLLYGNQQTWSKATDARPIFIDYARRINLDIDRFVRDLDGPQADARVVADFQRGQAAGVTGTPTIFINGRQLRQDMTTGQGIRAAINYLLGQKGP